MSDKEKADVEKALGVRNPPLLGKDLMEEWSAWDYYNYLKKNEGFLNSIRKERAEWQ